MPFWTDAWLNESFATWMAARNLLEWAPKLGPIREELLGEVSGAMHNDALSIADYGSEVETITWRARARAHFPDIDVDKPWPAAARSGDGEVTTRPMYFAGEGAVDGKVYRDSAVVEGVRVLGPAVIESPATTIVIVPGMAAERVTSGSIVMTPVA